MITFNDYSKELLRKFFYLLPSSYGEKSQTLNHHNLIHLADDVSNLKLPLSSISAFWGENYIGKIKKLVKSPYKPLTQILNRLSEIENEDKLKIKKQTIIKKCVIDEVSEIFISEGVEYLRVKSVIINNVYLSSTQPHNVVILKYNNIVIVDKLLIRKIVKKSLTINDIYIVGREMVNNDVLFKYPAPSTDVGIFVGEQFSNLTTLLPITLIKNKCISLNYDEKFCIISLLHL